MPHKRGLFLLISNRKLWKQFASTVSCFQRLSILGQFPAFLLHTSVHKALSITVPGFPLCEALYLSFLWSSLQIASARGRGQLHTMLTTVGWLFVDHHARTGTLAQLHTNHTGRQRPSWVTKRQLSWGAVLSLRIIITSLFSTFRRSLSQFVLCHRGPGGWGLGRLAPDSQPGLKIAPKIASF